MLLKIGTNLARYAGRIWLEPSGCFQNGDGNRGVKVVECPAVDFVGTGRCLAGAEQNDGTKSCHSVSAQVSRLVILRMV